MSTSMNKPEPKPGTQPVVGVTFPASYGLVHNLLIQDKDTGDGRSNFYWIQLANGDVGLVVFPQGDCYDEMIDSIREDRQRAEAAEAISVIWTTDDAIPRVPIRTGEAPQVGEIEYD